MYAYTNLETALNAKPGRIKAVIPGFCLARAMLAAIGHRLLPRLSCPGRICGLSYGLGRPTALAAPHGCRANHFPPPNRVIFARLLTFQPRPVRWLQRYKLPQPHGVFFMFFRWLLD